MILHGLPPVVSSELKLSLPTVFFALVFNVLLNRLLVSADSRSKVANRPDAHLTVVDVFQEWELSRHETSGITLEDTHSIRDSYLRRHTDEKMNVIFIRIDFENLNLRMAPRNRFHDSLHVLGHTALAEYLPSILGAKDKMIAGVVDRMRLSAVLHASILA
jgi:hypothetical protein